MPIGSYDDFYAQYEPFVAAFMQRRVRPDDVEDLVSDVFVTAWRRRDIVPDDALPWLYRTARNVVGTRYRSAARLAALREKLLSVPIEAVGDPADVASGRERLYRAFAELTEDDRELLLLTAWEGLSNDEIATVLGTSPNATAVRMHRARARFEAALGANDGQFVRSNDDSPIDISTTSRVREGHCE